MEHLPTIYAAAVLLPLASFFAILIFANQVGRFAAWIATGAILSAGVLSFIALGLWLTHHFPEPLHSAHAAAHEAEHSHGEHGAIHGKMPLAMVSLLQEREAAKSGTEAETQPPTTAT